MTIWHVVRFTPFQLQGIVVLVLLGTERWCTLHTDGCRPPQLSAPPTLQAMLRWLQHWKQKVVVDTNLTATCQCLAFTRTHVRLCNEIQLKAVRCLQVCLLGSLCLCNSGLIIVIWPDFITLLVVCLLVAWLVGKIIGWSRLDMAHSFAGLSQSSRDTASRPLPVCTSSTGFVIELVDTLK